MFNTCVPVYTNNAEETQQKQKVESRLELTKLHVDHGAFASEVFPSKANIEDTCINEIVVHCFKLATVMRSKSFATYFLSIRSDMFLAVIQRLLEWDCFKHALHLLPC